MNWADLEVWDVVKLPEGYWINEDYLTVRPHITEIKCQRSHDRERFEMKARVEWTMQTPVAVGGNPMADYSPQRYSEWFDLTALQPA